MGVGGGGLFVLYLTFIRSVDQKTARVTNLAFFVFAALGALPVHLAKRNIDRRLAAILAISAVAGVIPGAALASYLPSDALRKAFGAVLTAASIYIFISSATKRKVQSPWKISDLCKRKNDRGK